MGILAYLLALIIGLAAGIIAALKQNSALGLRLDGARDARAVGAELCSRADTCACLCSRALFASAGALGRISSLVLPVITLSAIYAAYIARLTRAGMLEVMRSDYIRTARAKGLG